MAADLYLGIDLGGTDVKLGVCSAEGAVQQRHIVPTNASRGPEETLARIGAEALRLMNASGGVIACGVGFPGPLDPSRRSLQRATNLPGWVNVPVPEILTEQLGVPTVLENDANCAAWGEHRVGIGQGTTSLVLITLGTGVGGGIVLKNQLWTGSNGGAGRIGHISIDPAGPHCGCGQRGCLEQYASATAVSCHYGRGTAEDAFEAAQRGDQWALGVIQRASEALATGLAAVVEILQPHLLVLGGGMAAGGSLLLDGVRQGLKNRVACTTLASMRVELTSLGSDAGWIGAALWSASAGQE